MLALWTSPRSSVHKAKISSLSLKFYIKALVRGYFKVVSNAPFYIFKLHTFHQQCLSKYSLVRWLSPLLSYNFFYKKRLETSQLHWIALSLPGASITVMVVCVREGTRSTRYIFKKKICLSVLIWISPSSWIFYQ